MPAKKHQVASVGVLRSTLATASATLKAAAAKGSRAKALVV
jgi:hypothetical protein